MIFQITVPEQKTLIEDIEVDTEVAIIGQVTGFWGYTENDKTIPLHWGLNPNGLTFSSFPDVFTSLVLSKYPDSGAYRLTAKYEYTDPDDGELIKQFVVFEVASVEEVRDFSPISS